MDKEALWEAVEEFKAHRDAIGTEWKPGQQEAIQKTIDKTYAALRD